MAALIDAVTELFTKQSKTQDLLTKLLSVFASFQVQTQAPLASIDAIPATMPYQNSPASPCAIQLALSKDILGNWSYTHTHPSEREGVASIMQPASNENTAVFL